MNVLAIDTCFAVVAVGAAAGVSGPAMRVAVEARELASGHAEALVPMIEAAMKSAGLSFASLDRIVATVGPGTFTGVRSGVAAARGIALATGAGVVGVSSLWAIAAGALEACSRDGGASGRGVLVAMDARLGQLFVQATDADGAQITAPAITTPEEAARLALDRGLDVTGSGAESVVQAGRLNGDEITLRYGNGNATLRAQNTIRAMLNAGASRAPADRLVPLYLRPPDAKPQTGKSLPWSLS